jgi:peptide/nickel transport system permease protein
MFAYLVKRIISGVLVVTLVSMAIFLLFWYGPQSPARTICDNETQNRCTPARLETYERTLGFQNPVYEEYGKFAKGLFVDRTIVASSNEYECAAPCLGISYNTKKPVK